MNKHLNSDDSYPKIFDDHVSQLIDIIDNDEFDSILWIEKDTVRICGYDDGSEFFSIYIPSVLEKVSIKKGMDLEVVRNRMKGKIRIRGGLSHDE